MKKVAILGKLETKFKAPFDDYNFDIWVYNYHVDYHKIPRVTTWFDLHKVKPNPRADIIQDNFPFEKCIDLVGGKYFNNTASWLIAYAILEGYEEIHLYGMRFQSDAEQRFLQYENVRELLFFAKGKGITVKTPYDTIMLCHYPLYGLE